uniref:Nbl1_Borealin_N domain-containing protein n=1 Tax=Mesocestoides corti TaxID=53468 RepID=A0A5K3FP64_MESCO
MPRPALRKDSSIVDKESAHAALAKILDAARANFERGIQGKRAVFERYLQTRVNWLRAQLTREAENSGTLEMNNLEVLRILKPHVLPKELRTPSKGLMPPPPPPSSLSALKTIRRMAGRPRMVQASTTAAKKFRSALNCSTTVASTTAGESLVCSCSEFALACTWKVLLKILSGTSLFLDLPTSILRALIPEEMIPVGEACHFLRFLVFTLPCCLSACLNSP